MVKKIPVCIYELGHARRMIGVSLIELVVTVAIIGILAAFSYPKYQDYVMRSRRIDATQHLLNLASKQELNFARTGRYTTSIASLINRSNPHLSEEGFYTIVLEACDGVGLDGCYSSTARPIGVQQSDELCASFTLTSRGERSATGLVGGNPAADTTDSCW